MMMNLLLSLVFCSSLLLFLYIRKVRRSFWPKLGISTPPQQGFIFGHMPSPFTKKFANLGLVIKNEFYDYFKSKKLSCVGIYSLRWPALIPIDLDLIKKILIKDFNSFDQKGLNFNEKMEPHSANLFSLEGQRWKNLRLKLTPTFTSGKMKLMFPTVIKCTEPLIQKVETAIANGTDNHYLVNVKDMCGKYTTDVIGSCAFGIECNSFENDNFHFYANKALDVDWKAAVARIIMHQLPGLAKALHMRIFCRESIDFFRNTLHNNIKMRKSRNEKRNDFVQLLIELSNTGAITDDEIFAQSLLFFLAGFETSSTTLSFCLYELALNLDVQEKVHQEILDAFNANNGELTYQSMGELKYLQQVIDETLRKYPPVTVDNRQCSKEYLIPGTKTRLPKGLRVYIPIIAIHYDSDYYPDPDKFDPERFSEENKKNLPSCAYLPFGEGPRLCIGFRFAYMQMKVGLAHLLKEHRFVPCEKTQVPLTYANALTLTTKEPIILKCQKI